MLARVLSASLLVAVVAGCEQPSATPASGIVVRKHYDEPSDATTILMVGETPIPVNHHHPAEWSLSILADDGTTRRVSVGEAAYNAAEIGGRYEPRKAER